MSKAQAKANFNSGDLEKYKTALAYARKSKQSFQIVSTGLSRKILMPNGYKLNYFGRKGTNNLVEGAFLVMMVRREIDAYIEYLNLSWFERLKISVSNLFSRKNNKQ